jgi:CubicO group peptidase (beta-lactamase class C family)
MNRNNKLLAVLFAVATFSFCTRTVTGQQTLAKADAVRRLDGSVITATEIDATVTRVMKAAKVPGMGLAIVSDGKIAYLKGYGLRDKEKNLPMTPETVMSAASLTKVAFGDMVLQLVDKGQLNLDKPVYQYLPKPLPEYSNYQDLSGDARYKKITARMLLSHTSGFPNWRWFNDDRKLNIGFEPGSRYAYSGEGLLLLQVVVETITGKPLADLMQEQVFEPFGMARTSMTWQPRFESDYADGYDEYGRSLGPQRRTRAEAAGSMLTTVQDFAKFLQAVLEARGMRRQTEEMMLRPQIGIQSKHQFPTFSTETTDENKGIQLSYGLTWGLYRSPYGKVFFKEGHDDGHMNYAVCFEGKKSCMVMMTNSSNGEGIYKELLETLQKNSYTPIEWEGFTPYNLLPPRPPLKDRKEIVVDGRVLERYAGRYGVPPDLILVIRRESNHLSIQENDEPKQELFASSDTVFFSKAAADEFTFEVDTSGRVTRMVLRTGGREIPITRID